jgi:phenylpyruvate tautomerase PptA (4-oxalocrotonate tautomerase family)
MAQIKIYARREFLASARDEISDAIHACAVEFLGLPEDKRFHRFISLSARDFVHPDDRSGQYTILEVSMFEGRTAETKKAFIRGLFARLGETPGITPQDLEITIFETPRANWGIRGLPGDELTLGYQVTV